MEQRPSKSRPWIILGVVVVLVLPMIVVTAWVVLERMRATSSRVPCATQLRQIGQALLLYSLDNNGVYPDRLEHFVLSGALTPKILVCPYTDHSEPRARTNADLEKAYAQPGHVSFVFIAGGMRDADLTSEDVVAYDAVGNHDSGSNVLFGDGHVAFIMAEALPKLLQDTRDRAATRPAR